MPRPLLMLAVAFALVISTGGGLLFWRELQDRQARSNPPPSSPVETALQGAPPESPGMTLSPEGERTEPPPTAGPGPASSTPVVPAAVSEAEVAATTPPALDAPEGAGSAAADEDAAAGEASPSFDVVRVEPSGEALFAGRAPPRVDVEILADGEVFARATADADGAFVAIPDSALTPGEHEIAARIAGATVAAGAGQVAVTVPLPGGGAAEIVTRDAEQDVAAADLTAEPPSGAVAETDPSAAASSGGSLPRAAESSGAAAGPQPPDATPEVAADADQPDSDSTASGGQQVAAADPAPVDATPSTEPTADAAPPVATAAPDEPATPEAGPVAEQPGAGSLQDDSDAASNAPEVVVDSEPETQPAQAPAEEAAGAEQEVAARRLPDSETVQSGATTPSVPMADEQSPSPTPSGTATEPSVATVPLEPSEASKSPQMSPEAFPAAPSAVADSASAGPQQAAESSIAGLTEADGALPPLAYPSAAPSFDTASPNPPAAPGAGDAGNLAGRAIELRGEATVAPDAALLPEERIAAMPSAPSVSDGEAVSTLPGAPDAPPSATAEAAVDLLPDLSIKAAEAEADTLYVAGEAKPGTLVRVFAEDELIGVATASNGGTWLVEATKSLPAGEVVIRADAMAQNQAEPSARVELPFLRHADGVVLEPVVVAASADGQSTAADARLPPSTFVMIRRGDNLWRISRRNYGRGIRFKSIFAANGDRIRNPHRIYPGQVFVLPTRDRRWETEVE